LRLHFLPLASMSAAAQFVLPTMEIKNVAPDVYTMQHPFGSSNATFVVTNDGVLMFNADIRTASQITAAIRKVTDKKVRYVVPDHRGG
jgi:hypothetical protein